MFARTTRLLLRPAWPEDAVELAAAIGHAGIAGMLLHVPFPYTVADAQPFVAGPRGADEPRFLIVAQDTPSPGIVGGIGISDHEGTPDLGYWLVPDARGRGYATEAGRAVIDMARHALPLDRLVAWHFADNPASAAVLRRLGFVATGRQSMQQSAARGAPAQAVEHALDLVDEDARMPIAA